MTKSSTNACGGQPDLQEPLLHLPDGAGFHPVKTPISLEAITRLSEERLPLINGRPGAEEKRLARKARVQFKL